MQNCKKEFLPGLQSTATMNITVVNRTRRALNLSIPSVEANIRKIDK